MKRKYIIGLLALTFSLAFIFLTYFALTTPVIKIRNNKDLYSLGDTYNESGADAYLLFKKLDVDMIIVGGVNTNVIGTYDVNYSFYYKNKKISLNKKIDVKDLQAPVITLTGGETHYLCKNTEYQEAGFQAIDNYDGDITDKVKVTKQGKKVIYEVKDSSGNNTSIVRVIKTGDNTKPVITINGGNRETVPINGVYIEKGAVAKDNCDGDISSSLEIKNYVDTSTKGSYFVTYRSTDTSGNIEEISKSVIVRAPQENKANIIYLTFDDGPTKLTEDILDILKEENVLATFFVIGTGSDETIKRAALEGHAIGVHSYSHKYSEIYSSEESFFQDFDRIKNRIKNITGKEYYISRFPGGSSNTVSRFNKGIMSKLALEVQNRGYEYFDWNISSGDASGKAISSDKIVKNITSQLRKSRSNVVLMHDSGSKYSTRDALKRIIKFGKDNGYVFKALEYDSYPAHHNILN